MKKTLTYLYQSATVMSWLNNIVKFGNGIFVLPLILARFSEHEIAFWFLINTIMGFAMLADSGFGPTLIRAVTYFHAGAEKIPSNREEFLAKRTDKNLGKPHLKNLSALLSSTARIYNIISLVVILLLSTLGTVFIYNLLSLSGHQIELWISFGIIILNSFVRLQTVRWASFMRGFNFVALQNRMISLIGAVKIVVFVVLLLIGVSIVVLIAYQLAESIVVYQFQRWYIMRWFKKHKTKPLSSDFDKTIFKTLWPATWRLGGIFWGGFMVNSGNSIVISQIDNVELMASFLLTRRILGYLRNIADSAFYANLPKVYHLLANRKFTLCKQKISFYIFTGVSILSAGLLFTGLFGNILFDMAQIKTRLVPGLIFFIMAINMVLTIHHSYHASIYYATNQVPFFWPALISGSLVVGLGFAVVAPYGVLGIVLVHLLVQLAFSHWYPVWLSLRLLKWPFFNYLKSLPYWSYKSLETIWARLHPVTINNK